MLILGALGAALALAISLLVTAGLKGFELAKIKKHLADPDPELLASQLGVSGRGSGSTNPYDEYVWWQKRTDVIGDMMILMGGFEITFVDVARAIIEKRNLEIGPKTLMNSFRELYGDPKLFHRKAREFDAFFCEEDRDTYLKEFPRRTLRFIKDKKPRLKLGAWKPSRPQ